MTRQQWKKIWRAIRVARRESSKAWRDCMLYGTGVIYFPKNGDPRHIPLAEVRFG